MKICSGAHSARGSGTNFEFVPESKVIRPHKYAFPLIKHE